MDIRLPRPPKQVGIWDMLIQPAYSDPVHQKCLCTLGKKVWKAWDIVVAAPAGIPIDDTCPGLDSLTLQDPVSLCASVESKE